MHKKLILISGSPCVGKTAVGRDQYEFLRSGQQYDFLQKFSGMTHNYILLF